MASSTFCPESRDPGAMGMQNAQDFSPSCTDRV
jgi:hypothetical protein